MRDNLEQLAALMRRGAADLEAWESAELHLLGVVLRERLAYLDVVPTAETAAALMVVAQMLAERAPEWGGDVRSALAEVGLLGLELLDADR